MRTVSHNARFLVIKRSHLEGIMGFITDEERQEPLRVGEAIYLSPSHLCEERRHLSGSGVFFYHQILPLNPDKCSILQKGKSTIPVIDEIEEETAQFCFVNSEVRWKGIMPVCYAVSKD